VSFDSAASPFQFNTIKISGDIQGGSKVGIHYIVYKLLYNYFWPTMYDPRKCNKANNKRIA